VPWCMVGRVAGESPRKAVQIKPESRGTSATVLPFNVKSAIFGRIRFFSLALKT